MEFIKMHGLGNDFIILDGFLTTVPGDHAALARMVCDRHFSIGGDGLVIILPAESADAEMRIFNPDGSQPEMCGNAIRCVAKYLYETGHVHAHQMRIKTLAGMMDIKLALCEDKVTKVSVDMGAPRVTGRSEILIVGQSCEFMCVTTGNPHAVTYSIYPEDDVFMKYGPRIERNPVFPEGTNVEFCRVDSPRHISIRVWERGAGPTLACGTGATASFFAGVKAGLLENSVVASLPGGELEFVINEDGHVIMTGPAETAFRGRLDI